MRLLIFKESKYNQDPQRIILPSHGVSDHPSYNKRTATTGILRVGDHKLNQKDLDLFAMHDRVGFNRTTTVIGAFAADVA